MWKKSLQLLRNFFAFSFVFVFSLAFASEALANNCFCWFEGEEIAEQQYCTSNQLASIVYCEDACSNPHAIGDQIFKSCIYTDAATSNPTICAHAEGGASSSQTLCNRYPQPPEESAETTAVVGPTEPQNFIAPELAVTLDPDFEFSPILSEGGLIKVTYLTEYLQMLYNYLLGITSVVAIVMIMFYGGMYIFSAGSSALAQKAVGGIKKTLWGFGLLFVCVALLELVNPELTLFRALEIQSIDELELDTYLEGTDAPTGTSHASSLAATKEPCQAIYQEALAEGTCSMSNNQKFYSPTGTGPNCGNHHWFDGGANGEWKNIKNLDWAAPWGSAIRAPFAGTVSYKKQEDTSNRCGNRIYLEGNNARITICHAKDFLDESGVYQGQRTVQAGATIGHVGGECCASSTAPSNYTGTTCDASGTACTDPTSSAACQCQSPEQSGNTTGGHAHVTWQGEGNFLPCLIDGAP